MIDDVIHELVIGAISSATMYMLHEFWKQISKQTGKGQRKVYSKRNLIRQFYLCTLSFPVFLMAGVLFPATPDDHPLLPYIKVLCFLAAFFSLIFSLGAFDAAISLYPTEQEFKVPTKQASDENTDDCGKLNL